MKAKKNSLGIIWQYSISFYLAKVWCSRRSEIYKKLFTNSITRLSSLLQFKFFILFFNENLMSKDHCYLYIYSAYGECF